MKKEIIIRDLEETKNFAKELAQEFSNIDDTFFILLNGDLGAGKTTFSKALLNALGVIEPVSSPTFVIMRNYNLLSGKQINHVDAYRLQNDSEVEMYLDEFEKSLNVIEWYENMNINFNDYKWLKIDIKIINEDERKFIMERN